LSEAGIPAHLLWWSRSFSLRSLGVPQTQAETGVSPSNGATPPTKLTVITCDPMAAKGLLRHSSVNTTLAHYIKDVPEVTANGNATRRTAI